MYSFVALYRGDTLADSDLVAVSSDPGVVKCVIKAVTARVSGDANDDCSKEQESKPPTAKAASQ